jgi:hypothetical protein
MDQNNKTEGSQFVNYAQNRPAPPAPPAPLTPPVPPIQPPVQPAPVVVPPTPVVPPAAPVTPPPVYTPPVAAGTPKKGHHLLWIILVILLIAVVAYAYFFIFSPSWAIPQALSKMDQQNKLNATVTLSTSADSSYYPSSKVSVATDYDRTDAANPSLKSLLSAVVGEYDVAGEVRLVNNVLYGRVTKIPPALLKSGQTNIQNIWYSLKLDTIKELAESYSPEYSSKIGLDKLGKHISLADQYEKIKKAQIISDLKWSGLATEGGMGWKYTSTISKDKLADFYIDQTLAQTKEAPSAKEIDSMKTYLHQMLALVQLNPITITTSLFGGELKSISSGITYEPTQGTQGKSLKIALLFNAAYKINPSNYVIETPDGSLALDDAIKQSLVSSREKGVSAAIKSNISNLRAMAEIYYDKNHGYQGVCKSADFAPVITSVNQLKSSLVCRDSAKAYIVSAPLPDSTSSAQTYFCVDSTGYAMVINKVPSTGFVCKTP